MTLFSLLHLPMKYVNILHILVIGTSLLYISYYQSKTPFYIYYLLIVLGLCIILFVPIPNLELTNFRNVLYITHYVLFIPGFLALAYYGLQNKLSKDTYSALGFIGLFIIMYHLYKLIIRIM
jgi:hypothetical protein